VNCYGQGYLEIFIFGLIDNFIIWTFAVICCIDNENRGVSLPVCDVDRHVIIRKLLDSILNVLPVLIRRKISKMLKSTIFCDITPCSPLKVNRRFGGTYRLNLQGRRMSRARNQRESRYKAGAFTLVSCSTYYSTLKMEAIRSSETSVDFQRTTLRYIPEDGTHHSHRCENLKSYK
jgi:hypothetical protein